MGRNASFFSKTGREKQRWMKKQWMPGRWKGMPVLFWMFRFQNIRTPKYSAFQFLQPDAAALNSPSAKSASGLTPAGYAAEYQGVLIFFHSHIQNRTGIPFQLIRGLLFTFLIVLFSFLCYFFVLVL